MNQTFVIIDVPLVLQHFLLHGYSNVTLPYNIHLVQTKSLLYVSNADRAIDTVLLMLNIVNKTIVLVYQPISFSLVTFVVCNLDILNHSKNIA